MTVTSQEDRPPWIYRVVPAFDALRHYRLTDARADLLAGITVAAVAVPQAMAYALAAGLPAQYGLYTAIMIELSDNEDCEDQKTAIQRLEAMRRDIETVLGAFNGL